MAMTEVFTNLLLALFGLIGSTEGGRDRDPLVVLAEMLGISAEQLLREIGLFVMGNYHDISALDTSNKGVDYYVCGLPHCRVPDKMFDTLSAWKKHVALARYHAKTGFCTKCERFLEVPVGIPEEDIKLFRPCFSSPLKSFSLRLATSSFHSHPGGSRDGHCFCDVTCNCVCSRVGMCWLDGEDGEESDDQPQPGPSNEPHQPLQAIRKRSRCLADVMLEEFTKKIMED
ncbi:hypothetical protein Tcan_02705 [Toxocara canis]|uniref:Uncharacterized protein n=1 Tax=Toxocara canis TaxID=6265 RepID=A0A0B2V2V5_TOXCA|nr:hypothetical protein Tcan_02705 [Toxocara canis]